MENCAADASESLSRTVRGPDDVLQLKESHEWFELKSRLDQSTIGPSSGTADKVDFSEAAPHILVSNPDVLLPSGLQCFSDYVSDTQRRALLKELDGEKFSWEGFDQRRRVWRFRINRRTDLNTSENVGNEVPCQDAGNAPPPGLMSLALRLEEDFDLQGDYLSVEEFPRAKWHPTGQHASKHRLTTFESFSPPPNPDQTNPSVQAATTGQRSENKESNHDSEKYFVARIPLNIEAIQHINQPAKRLANCWQLKSDNHQTDILMKPGSLWIKSGACLSDWRHQIRTPDANDTQSDLVLIFKLYKLPPNENVKSTIPSSDEAHHNTNLQEQERMREHDQAGLRDLLTIVITTSPIRSNPSTELIETIMETFVHAGPDFAYDCRKVIVCDGFRVSSASPSEASQPVAVSKRYGNVKQAMRNGIVSEDQAERYRQFKIALRELCNQAKLGASQDLTTKLFRNTVIEELEERHGYGFALRHALQHCVPTPFVCVIQHDRTFMRPTPLKQIINCMLKNPIVKYVGLSMRSNLTYRDIFLHKYGKSCIDEMDEMILRPSDLLVDYDRYGHSTDSMTESCCSDRILQSIVSVSKAYQSSNQRLCYEKWLQENPLPPGKHQMSLTPTLFWYDNIHICETAHYRDFIFDPSRKMVARGGFVEDKLSPVIVRTIERFGLKEGHSRFGCYLLDDHSGLFFTGHLDGGSYFTAEQRSATFPAKQTGQETKS